jgi:hypothetical protein
LVLSPPLPFTNKAFNQAEFAKVLLQHADGITEQDLQTRFNVASILAPQNSEIAQLILSQLGSQLTEGILQWKDPKNVNNRLAVRWANFWINLLADPKVKARLQHDELPIKLYELLKEAADADRIVKPFHEDYLVLIVELIMRTSAGNKELEERLTNTVIQDLELLQKKRDMPFINKVLLPMIRNEMTVPICIAERKGHSGQWAVNVDSLSSGQG